MPARRSLIIWIGRIVLTLALLLVAPPTVKEEAHVEPPEGGQPLYGRTLDCVIDSWTITDNRAFLKAGFNYEILRTFAWQHNCSASIRIARSGENYIDSLAFGTIDILVMDADTTVDAPIMKCRNVGHHVAWYVRECAAEYRDINLWLSSFTGTKEYKDIRSVFTTDYNPYTRVRRGVVTDKLSPYDDLVRKYAASLGWDWRLLVAMIYQESKFAISTVSTRGATGLMQIMPSTALQFGVTDLVDPEQNLLAGTSFLAQIQKGFSTERFSPEERVNFTLAAYNAGEPRIADCRRVAAARGLDNTKWSDVAGIIPDMKEYVIQSPDSTVIRTGHFMGTETVNYVSQVLGYYGMFCRICPER